VSKLRERDWERSDLLEPQPGPRFPEMLSDGGGLPFLPAALAAPPGLLDPDDRPVAALLAHLTARAAPKRTVRVPWGREPPPPPPPPRIEDWRELARTEDEVLFARGVPPRMLTASLRCSGRRRAWTFVGSSAARPIRVARDGMRASSWRLDPDHDPPGDESVLRVLISEQAFASGQPAYGRILPPEIYADEDELVLTVFVTPLPGFQNGTPNPETPARIVLPHPVGARRLIDGALPLLTPA
jgi:hypothetical protein